jgi:hypothetical protein
VWRWKAVPSTFLYFIVNYVTHLHIVHRVRPIELIRRFGKCISSSVSSRRNGITASQAGDLDKDIADDMFCYLQATHTCEGDNKNNRHTADDTIISGNRLCKQFVNRFVRRNAQGC